MILLIVLATICTAGYVSLLSYYLFHARHRTFIDKPPTSYPFCSIIIAARNEEATIDRCLRSATNQTYPADRIEVIVVNDGSEDNTVNKVSAYPSVKLLRTTKDAQGKKHALTLGISAAQGEYIFTTDADCEVQFNWLQSMIDAFETKTNMVTGPVLLQQPSNAFERFQALDIAGLALITAGGIKSGLHHLANGANMAFRKRAFETVGGFKGNSEFASGDDVFLAQSIAKAFPGSLQCQSHPDAIVLTDPCRALDEFVSQRLRWASKNHALREKSVFRIWVFIWIVFVLNFITLLITFFYSMTMALLPFTLIITIGIVEYAFLRAALDRYRNKEQFGEPLKTSGLSTLAPAPKERKSDLNRFLEVPLKGFFVSFLMHYLYIMLIGIMAALNRRYHWKGRKVR